MVGRETAPHTKDAQEKWHRACNITAAVSAFSRRIAAPSGRSSQRLRPLLGAVFFEMVIPPSKDPDPLAGSNIACRAAVFSQWGVFYLHLEERVWSKRSA